ncbi:hypothetical protein BDD12DRAFT_924987 [Trichophaea hybrida]|nr:hypothetical protein BDD12DRAFT_924987 [Trichophaea hybrida]
MYRRQSASSGPSKLSLPSITGSTSVTTAPDLTSRITPEGVLDQLDSEADWLEPPSVIDTTTRSQSLKLSLGPFGGAELKREITLVGSCVRTRTSETSASFTTSPFATSLGTRRGVLAPPTMFTTTNIQVGPVKTEYSRETHNKIPQYIVVGVFRKDSSAPREAVVKLERNTSLSSALWRGMFRVRGWRYFLSLKVVRGFGIYKCDPNNGSHRRIPSISGNNRLLTKYTMNI